MVYFENIFENGLKLIIQSGKQHGVTFIGTEGKAWANRGAHKLEPESLTGTVIGPNEIHLYKSDYHFRNFIDCVISRKESITPAEVAHRSITIAHLGNIAMMLNQNLDWDPIKEQTSNVPETNQMLSRTMREPWASVDMEYRFTTT